jgi:hypothetical protein
LSPKVLIFFEYGAGSRHRVPVLAKMAFSWFPTREISLARAGASPSHWTVMEAAGRIHPGAPGADGVDRRLDLLKPRGALELQAEKARPDPGRGYLTVRLVHGDRR